MHGFSHHWTATLALTLFAAVPAAAQSGPKICNGTDGRISVAIAWWGRDNPGLHSQGWSNIVPGECRYLFSADSSPYHRYYFAYKENLTQDTQLSRAWTTGPANGEGYCIGDERAFDIDDATGDCPAPYIRRGFLSFPHGDDATYLLGGGDDDEDGDVTITWDDGRPGSRDW